MLWKRNAELPFETPRIEFAKQLEGVIYSQWLNATHAILTCTLMLWRRNAELTFETPRNDIDKQLESINSSQWPNATNAILTHTIAHLLDIEEPRGHLSPLSSYIVSTPQNLQPRPRVLTIGSTNRGSTLHFRLAPVSSTSQTAELLTIDRDLSNCPTDHSRRRPTKSCPVSLDRISRFEFV